MRFVIRQSMLNPPPARCPTLITQVKGQTYQNLLILPHTGHNPLHHTPHHLGRIFQTLINAQLYILAAQKHRVPTQGIRRRLTGDSRPRTALRKHHSDRFTEQ